ncbi:hypothetical protein U9M48_011151, partial [Paspalum notatum var. saurae]
MHGNLVDLRSKSTTKFQEEVIFGICFILNNVCYKVLSDLIKEKAKQGMAVHDVEESFDSNYHSLHQYMKDRPCISISSHQYREEGSLSRRMSSAIKCLQEIVKTSNFGDVKSLSIEDPTDVRPPQYALVTFGSLETMLIILDGKEKVKFLIAGGKHLWARRYVPKRSTKRAKTWLGYD